MQKLHLLWLSRRQNCLVRPTQKVYAERWLLQLWKGERVMRVLAIKRCPRCACKGTIRRSEPLKGAVEIRLICNDCGFMTTPWYTEREAVREWNERRLDG